MLGQYEYIGKLEKGDYKVEFYDTGKKSWSFKKVFAFQVFFNNRLINEEHSYVPTTKDPLSVLDYMQESVELETLELDTLQIEYQP
jgi:hypothetical protein